MGLFSWLKGRDWDRLGIEFSRERIISEIELKHPNTVIRELIDDRRFVGLPSKDFAELVSRYTFSRDKWRKEISDCDDFAAEFLVEVKRGWAKVSRGEVSLAAGLARGLSPTGGVHRWVWQMDDAGWFHWWEGETNRLMVGQPKFIHRTWM
jgi:hypothetical protein